MDMRQMVYTTTKKHFLTGIPEDRKGMGNETVTDSKPGGNGDRKGAGNWQ